MKTFTLILVLLNIACLVLNLYAGSYIWVSLLNAVAAIVCFNTWRLMND